MHSRAGRFGLGPMFAWCGLALWALHAVAARGQVASAPRLVVLVVVDQMRWDYLERYRDRIHAGFARLEHGGAVFTEARYPYAKTETAQAHALMLSGQSPSVSGIPGDAWYDRDARRSVSAGESLRHSLIGTATPGGSPEQLLVPSLGDVMKQRDPRTLVLAASWKRYSAVLMGGLHADAAYWFDAPSGLMVTSDYYRHDYPTWVDEFNRTDPTAAFFGRQWLTHTMGAGTAPDGRFRTSLRSTPFANDVLLAFSKRMLASSGLGQDAVPDLLAVSFSALDYAGHTYGPETPELDDTFQQMDRQLGEFLQALDDSVGKGNWTLAMVADHGVAFLPEKVKARGGDAGLLDAVAFRATIRKALAEKWPDPDALIATFMAPEIYLDYGEAARRGIDAALLEDTVAAAARSQPGVAQAYTRHQILGAAGTPDPFLKAVANGFYPARSGDVYVLVKPNYYFSINHGTPYEYDVHVPLIFYGRGIMPGRFDRRVLMSDLAPTLAEVAGVRLAGVPGESLREALGTVK